MNYGWRRLSLRGFQPPLWRRHDLCYCYYYYCYNYCYYYFYFYYYYCYYYCYCYCCCYCYFCCGRCGRYDLSLSGRSLRPLRVRKPTISTSLSSPTISTSESDSGSGIRNS